MKSNEVCCTCCNLDACTIRFPFKFAQPLTAIGHSFSPTWQPHRQPH